MTLEDTVDQFDSVYAKITDCEVKEEFKGKCTVLMTIHKSKGLEHDNVIVLKWANRADVTVDELEEEHNCLYIAYTRARRQLHVVNLPIDESL